MSHFLFEIGVEEFPPSVIRPTAEYIISRLRENMEKERIGATFSTFFFTSSRIAVLMSGFPEHQADLEEKITGAPRKIATLPDGTLSKAGQAFIEKNNLTGYFFEDTPKGEVICGIKKEKGRPSEEIILATIDSVLSSVPFPKSMRWADKKLLFSRPIRWLLFLFNDKPVEYIFHGIPFSQTSFGHRFLSPGPVKVTFHDYKDILRNHYVIVDQEERRGIIRDKVLHNKHAVGGQEDIDESLLDEVTAITEFPHAVVGTIPERFMTLPPELITLVLKNDQRYFTVYEKGASRLLPVYISILNTVPSDDRVVIRGNNTVVASRLSDAAFYYHEDLSTDFAGLLEKLDSVTYQKDLGSYKKKIERTSAIAQWIGENCFHLSPAELTELDTAVKLIKNDLVTGVVFEFPELQGTIGKYYAKNAGFPSPVYTAIEEHYLPKGGGGDLPLTLYGTIASMADKTDTITGGFMAGMKPTGTKDKFAIRRNAIGLLSLCVHHERMNLDSLFEFAQTLVHKDNPNLKFCKDEILEFMKQRYNAVIEQDTPVIQAAVEADFIYPYAVAGRAATIGGLIKDAEVAPMVQLFKRAQNILKKAEGTAQKPDAELYSQAEEKALADQLGTVIIAIKNMDSNLEIAQKIITIKPVLDLFFDKVLVFDENQELRNNRIALINEVVTLVKKHIGDISYLNI